MNGRWPPEGWYERCRKCACLSYDYGYYFCEKDFECFERRDGDGDEDGEREE
jgi:hypothetical protein